MVLHRLLVARLDLFLASIRLSSGLVSTRHSIEDFMQKGTTDTVSILNAGLLLMLLANFMHERYFN